MPAKGRKRSAPKQIPQCQCEEQIKDILTRLELLEATSLTLHSLTDLEPMIVCEIPFRGSLFKGCPTPKRHKR